MAALARAPRPGNCLVAAFPKQASVPTSWATLGALGEDGIDDVCWQKVAGQDQATTARQIAADLALVSLLPSISAHVGPQQAPHFAKSRSTSQFSQRGLMVVNLMVGQLERSIFSAVTPRSRTWLADLRARNMGLHWRNKQHRATCYRSQERERSVIKA